MKDFCWIPRQPTMISERPGRSSIFLMPIRHRKWLCGLVAGVPRESQIARQLAEQGDIVIVPTLISRGDEFSTIAYGQKKTNQPHREFVYRQAYEMGRHVLGYEIQKVLTLVDLLQELDRTEWQDICSSLGRGGLRRGWTHRPAGRGDRSADQGCGSLRRIWAE